MITLKNEQSTTLDKQLKKYIVYFLYSSMAIHILYLLLYSYIGKNTFAFSEVIGMVINLFIIIYIDKLEFTAIKPFINAYLLLLSFLLYFFAFIYWKETPIAFLWYFMIPFGLKKIFDFRIIMYWSIYIAVLILLTIIIPDFWGLRTAYTFSPEDMSYINLATFISVLYLMMFILYFNHKISLLRLAHAPTIKKEKVECRGPNKTEPEEEQYSELYQQILAYIDEKKPFLNADFTISELAVSLNSNITYISKSINANTGNNFSTLINTYRINTVKKLIREEDYNKYTLMYMYTSVGFKHQSTFNKVFKQIEGITPTQYIEKMKKE